MMVYFWATERFINWGTLHKLPSQYYPDYHEECPNFVNHGITVVGWKDDPSIGNGGYWICKNTWGRDWGYDGFFNIEYDCLNLGGFIAWVDYDPESFNWGPITPEINGPTSGASEAEYTFVFTSREPDGDDDIYYYIDWGDGLLEEWFILSARGSDPPASGWRFISAERRPEFDTLVSAWNTDASLNWQSKFLL